MTRGTISFRRGLCFQCHDILNGILVGWRAIGGFFPAWCATFAIMTAIGLIVVHWISAGVGGYIAGRLRTRWVSLHTHEVFFRDTAHGFITWATATFTMRPC